MSFPKGVEIGQVELARDNATELTGHKTVRLGERTSGVQVAISYFFGCSHTPRRIVDRRGISADELAVARSAVLAALSTSGKLRKVPPRMARRLLSAEELDAGRVNFISVGSGRKRRGVPCAVAA